MHCTFLRWVDEMSPIAPPVIPSIPPPAVSVYVLQLQNGKFYVGKSQDPMKRIHEHMAGGGSAWTSLHPVANVVSIAPATSDFSEHEQTLKCMREHGIDNVRGDSFCTINLPDDQRRTLELILAHSKNLCFNCHQPGHLAVACPAPAEPRNDEVPPQKASAAEPAWLGGFLDVMQNFLGIASAAVGRGGGCVRCGRNSHDARDCFAHTFADGRPLKPGRARDEDTGCRNDPARSACTSVRQSSSASCARCGRTNHREDQCYAATHFDGHLLSEEDDESE